MRWDVHQPHVAWIDGGRSLIIQERGPKPRLVCRAFDLEHRIWFERYARNLMNDDGVLAGDPVHDRYAVATDSKLYVVEHRSWSGPKGDESWVKFEAALAPGKGIGLAFSPDGKRLAVTRRVLHDSEEAMDDDLHRVTTLDIGAPRGMLNDPEPEIEDPRYPTGYPPKGT